MNQLKTPIDAFKLRMRSVTLPVLQILDARLETIEHQLEQLRMKTPNLFQGSPMIVDVEALGHHCFETRGDWHKLFSLFRHYGIIPVGLQGGDLALKEIAEEAGLAVFNVDRTRNESHERYENDRPMVQKTEKRAPLISNEARTPNGVSKIITKPIRSGQQVYAEGGDLIILATVSPGAELLADGNIHVYGTLRGRALAGVQGYREARIFCQSLEADLLAIAGCYMTSETIDRHRKEGGQQVSLEDDRLVISSL